MFTKNWKRLMLERTDYVKAAWRNKQDGDMVVMIIQPRFTKKYSVVFESNLTEKDIASGVETLSEAKGIAIKFMESKI